MKNSNPKNRKSLVFSDIDNFSDQQILDLITGHLEYVSRAHSYHISTTDLVDVVVASSSENEVVVDIDFSDYTEFVAVKYGMKVGEGYDSEDETHYETLDLLVERVVEQIVQGSPVRKDFTQLIEGEPSLAGKISVIGEAKTRSFVPPVNSDVIVKFTVEDLNVSNSKLFEFFTETLNKIRQEERERADALIAEERDRADEILFEYTRATGNIVNLLTKEIELVQEKNRQLAKLAGIPKPKRSR